MLKSQYLHFSCLSRPLVVDDVVVLAVVDAACSELPANARLSVCDSCSKFRFCRFGSNGSACTTWSSSVISDCCSFVSFVPLAPDEALDAARLSDTDTEREREYAQISTFYTRNVQYSNVEMTCEQISMRGIAADILM